MSDRLHQQLSWQIGDVAITRLVEVVLNAPIKSLFPTTPSKSWPRTTVGSSPISSTPTAT